MKAHVGDHIVIASRAVGGVVRDGEIVETRGAGGSPPYLVRWSDSGTEGLYFPGTDAQVEAAGAAPGESPSPGEGPAHPLRSWTVSIDLVDSGPDTTAHAVLRAQTPSQLDAHGAAHRRPSDPDVREIGDEIAVARALRHLADRLIDTAAADIAGREGASVTLSEV